MKTSKHISKSIGYKVPESYFEEFKVDISLTKSHQHKSGFSIPENYFENLRIQTPRPTKVRKLREVYKTVAVAASLLVILASLLMGLILQNNQKTVLNFSQLNPSDIENYIEYEMMMDEDLYVDDKNLILDFNTDNIQNNTIIEDIDDSTLEQLMDY